MDSIQKDSDVISLRKVFVNYLHHWKVFAVVGGLSIVLAVLYLELYPKTYEIMSRMRIEDDSQLGNGSVGLGEAAGLMKSFGLGGGSGTAINIEDELATLSSNQLLRDMVLELGINVTYKKPFSFYSLYEECPILVTPDSTTQKTLNTDVVLTVNLNADGSAKVKVKSGKDYTVHSALDNLMSISDYHIVSSIVLSNEREIKTKGNILYLLIYYVMFLENKVPEEENMYF